MVKKYLAIGLCSALIAGNGFFSKQVFSQDNPDPTPVASQVIKHYRFGNGEPLADMPPPTPIVDFKAEAQKFKEMALESAKDQPNYEQIKKYFLDNYKEPEIGECFENKTDSIPAADSFPEGLEGENSPFQDMLFIHAKDLPPDPEIMFGITTIVVPFIPDQPNMSWEYITTFEVPCLPYRVRLQKSRMYFDQGHPALKNYTKSPAGEYHPYIKEVVLGIKPKNKPKDSKEKQKK